MKQQLTLADDSKEGVRQLLLIRLPWLFFGLIGGLLAIKLSDHYEAVLRSHLSLAFFIPLIVYMSDAVGTQTETIYVRNMARHRASVWTYLVKETSIGLLTGTLFGLIMLGIAYIWFGDARVAITVGLAMLASMTSAPIIAIIMPTILLKEHTDPAVGAGPFTTVVQDLLSLLLYFLIASAIIF